MYYKLNTVILIKRIILADTNNCIIGENILIEVIFKEIRMLNLMPY